MAASPAEGRTLALLRSGDLELTAEIDAGFNRVFAGVVRLGSDTVRCVYKPVVGERPLWDFPDGTLAGREVAAYLLSAELGWDLVPETVLRDGPAGAGMVQRWVDAAEAAPSLVDVFAADATPDGWRPVLRGVGPDGVPVVLAHADDRRLRRLALFDAVINNGDRKGGHLLTDVDARLYGIDHGVCLHTDNKLRTLLWGWAGDKIDPDERADLRRLRSTLDVGPDLGLHGGLAGRLAAYVTGAEVAAVATRLDVLLRTEQFPTPGGDWPPLPYPLF